jgi:asparagine synthase (glutamine-hydrolysing)
MCGIVGIIGQNAPVPADVLERATLSLAHRGPDDHGTVVLRQERVEVGLGNRRLAILDLSPLGHQPMQDPATGNWIAYNGEIYNFRDLRAELEQAGEQFASQSDTEVVLKAYARWGDGFVKRLRGMFALAIWDAKRDRLFVARDPMGIKPLYYFKSDRYFLFASEVRALLKTGLVPRQLNQTGLLSYLRFGSVWDPLTLIAGVHAVPAGHSLVWENGALHPQQYWDLRTSDSESGRPPLDPRESEEQVHGLLDEAVHMQLVSDVPVGVFLSGGIDSSALVAILARKGVKPSTFSIVFREAEYSEAEHSRAIAQRFRTDHHEITVSQQQVLGAIPEAIRCMDQPTMDGVNTYFVSQQARSAGVKVALSGLGGDELFAGYSSFRTVPRMERFADRWALAPRVVRKSLAKAYSLMTPASDQNSKLGSLVLGNGRVVHPYFLSRMLFTPGQSDGLVSGLGPQSCAALTEILRGSLGHTEGLDPVNRVSYLEARCYMLNTLLRDSDFMSMAHGLEIRVPLIDHRLAERVLAMPGPSKLDPNTPKPVLVRALSGQLPDGIVHRPKRGFTLPFERWLREEMKPLVEGALLKGAVTAAFLKADAPGKVWRSFLAGETSWSRPWSLFVLHEWCSQNL